MKTSQSFLFLCLLLGVRAGPKHEDLNIAGCSDTDGEYMYGLDGEVMAYTDFLLQKAVVALPKFADPITYTGLYEQALSNMHICRENLKVIRGYYNDTAVELDVPHSSIYTRDHVALGVENLLICHVTGFYPAPVRVRWTRNNQNLTDGATISQPYPKKDGTFHQFSSLKFTPQTGDIYSCTVEHRALDEPLTRVWDVEQQQPGIGPAVFCGVGLTLGLLGVASGTFFLIKGNECN